MLMLISEVVIRAASAPQTVQELWTPTQLELGKVPPRLHFALPFSGGFLDVLLRFSTV